jgi:hypothetical protein
MVKAKMWKLDLTNYNVKNPVTGAMEPFQVKESVANVLTSPNPNQRGQDGRQFLKKYKLAMKIMDWKEDYILLSAQEKMYVMQSAEGFTNWSMASGKLAERMIEGMEEVEVEDKQNLNQEPAKK